MVSRMERELDQEFGQFKSSELELDSRIESAETAPATADKTERGAAKAEMADAAEGAAEAMGKQAEVPA